MLAHNDLEKSLDTIGWFGALCGLAFGLILGSFVGMAAWRWPREENYMLPSHCPGCNKPLSPRDLVPVLSWVLARGKARCCGTPISARYPLIELSVAIPSALFGWHYGLSFELLLLTSLTATLVFLSIVDLDTGLIPDGSHLIIIALGMAWVYLHPPQSWWDPVLTLLQTAGVGGLIAGGYSYIRKRDMMGWGDVKLMAASALWLPAMLAPAYLLISGFVGALFGVWWTKRLNNPEFPFGPALAATLLALIGWQALWR